MTAPRHRPNSDNRPKRSDPVELARKQGLLDQPAPDYVELASLAFPTEADVEAFERDVAALRS